MRVSKTIYSLRIDVQWSSDISWSVKFINTVLQMNRLWKNSIRMHWSEDVLLQMTQLNANFASRTVISDSVLQTYALSMNITSSLNTHSRHDTAVQHSVENVENSFVKNAIFSSLLISKSSFLTYIEASLLQGRYQIKYTHYHYFITIKKADIFLTEELHQIVVNVKAEKTEISIHSKWAESSFTAAMNVFSIKKTKKHHSAYTAYFYILHFQQSVRVLKLEVQWEFESFISRVRQ